MALSVGIEIKNDRYRLRLPWTLVQGSQRYISTKLEVNEFNFRKVQRIALWIEEEIATGNLDPTLERYKREFDPKILLPQAEPSLHSLAKENEPVPPLMSLWEQYAAYRKPQVAETTFIKWYVSGYARIIQALPTQEPKQAIVIRNHLVAKLSPYMAKKTLTQLSACCRWAQRSGILPDNPFAGMAGEIRVPKYEGKEIDPFSHEERESILAAFQAHPRYKHYYPFVRFLFLTGCRTGEAIALQWKHVSSDLSYVTFAESYDGRLKIRKDTKTHKARKFPCNRALRGLLADIRPKPYQPSQLLFTSPTGIYLDSHNFTNRVWRGYKGYRGILQALIEEGKIERYRCPYNTRSTFITMALERGLTIPQVAALVGNSPQTLLEHYAGCQLHIEIPVT